MNQEKIKIALIAGEDSGDLLGAHLITGLKTTNQEFEFIGVGGMKMESAGLDIIQSNQEFAIMGISEVVKKLPKLLKLRKQIINNLIAAKPDLFIGIDAPDLNFPIEKKLKQKGIKIIHYVSPSIWAWREKRAINISKITDLVLTLFPFEPKYYEKVGGKAKFVGHPMAQEIQIDIDKEKSKHAIQLDINKAVLAVLPGSRSNELKAHSEIFIKTALKLKKDNPELQIISANTNDNKIEFIKNIANKHQCEIKFYKDATAVLKAADTALLASGTVALEAMLCKTPMVVGYKISPITYSIVKTFKMMKLPYFSLPNVLYGDFLVAEVLQKNLTVDNLYTEMSKIDNVKLQTKLTIEFRKLHEKLLNKNMNAAQAIINFLAV